jgi:hypothetical protein
MPSWRMYTPYAFVTKEVMLSNYTTFELGKIFTECFLHSVRARRLDSSYTRFFVSAPSQTNNFFQKLIAKYAKIARERERDNRRHYP